MRKIFYTLSVAMLMILFCMLGFAIVAAFVKFICWCFGLALNIKVALGIYAVIVLIRWVMPDGKND
jgi:fucose permease